MSELTAETFKMVTFIVGINLVLCSYRNLQGNAESAQAIRIIKEQILQMDGLGRFGYARPKSVDR